jgi:Flp pilus assembly secretin CpaC
MKQIYIFILFYINIFSVTKVINIKNIEVDPQLKDCFEKTWKALSSKNSFIDINSNKKIITLEGSTNEISEFEKFFSKLDKKPKVVRLELKFGFVSKHKEFNIGFTYFSIYNRNQTIKETGQKFGFTGLGASLLDFPTPTESPEGNPPILTSIVPNIHLVTTFFINPFGAPVTAADQSSFSLPITFGGPDLNTARLTPQFYLNETAGVIKEISKPEILVSNKEEAKFILARGLPIYTTVAEKKDGKTNLIYGVQYKSVGTVIKITPIIHKDDITLEILLENSEQVAGNTTPAIPDINGVILNPPTMEIFRTFQRVRLKIGESIVLSGFTQTKNTLQLRKVPILYKIPILGNFVQQTSKQNLKQYGVILITPTIIN